MYSIHKSEATCALVVCIIYGKLKERESQCFSDKCNYESEATMYLYVVPNVKKMLRNGLVKQPPEYIGK